MRRIIQFVMFMSVLFFALLAVNYFIFFTMGILLDLSSITIYSLVFLFAISYPASAVLEKTVSHILTRAFYTISSAWMGISVFIVFLIIGYEILNFIFNIPPFTAGIGIIIVASFVSIYAILNSMFFEIKEVIINIPNLKEEMQIVQLSDIHIGSVRNSGFMNKIVEKTNHLNPDIVLITGDTVDGSAKLHPRMFNAIDGLKAPSFLIIGNHEVYEGLQEVLEVLSTTKTKILRDELVEVHGIQIIGIDYSFDKDHLKNVLSKLEIDEFKPSILMYHVPNEIETVNKAGINLQLSGHTHKGQLFPFNFLGKLFFPYFSGLYEYNETSLYVSQGTGTWGPPMRLGSKNEITLIKLKNV
ncbi:MAG: metallophosphoesterase [Methanobacterium sp.]